MPSVPEPAASRAASLHGPVLAVARGTWLVVATFTFVYVLVSLPAAYSRFQTVCPVGAECGFLTLRPADLPQLSRMGLSVDAYAAYVLGCKALFTAVSFVIGTALFWRKSDQRIALLVALALVTLGGSVFTGPAQVYTGVFNSFWYEAALIMSFLGNTLIVLCYYLIPNGRFVPAWIVVPAAIFVLMQIDEYFFNILTPLLAQVSLLPTLGTFAFIILAQVYRYFRVSGPIERQQTRWIVLGIIGTAVGSQIAQSVLPSAAFPHVPLVMFDVALFSFSLLLTPVAIGVAILRYRLWDIDVFINRTLVYVTLTALVVALYVLIVGSLSAFLQVSGNLIVSLIATGVVAVLFQPLRERLQRGANRLMFGERDDPYSVLSRLGRRLGETATPEALLPNVVETIGQALKVPYAAIALDYGGELQTVAAYGRTTSDLVRLPLVYQGEAIGELALARRAPGEFFSKVDMGLLESIAQEAGMAAHAVQLTADLQRSRERLVTTREEERRRLRRDLHDGLGPVLGALTLKLDAARNLLAADPEAVDRLLVDLKAQSQGAIADVRRLVYELRPPALDDLGLASALREYANQCANLGGLRIALEIPGTFPVLPAAVEVATYRIVQEGLNNVVRHAKAGSCLVRVAIDGTLDVEISDDGAGLPPDRRAGIGLISMRERAEELGGSFEVSTRAKGGTRVLARLPLAGHSNEIIAAPVPQA